MINDNVDNNDYENDSFSSTSEISFFGRIKSALTGLIVGPIFIIASIWGLSYVETKSLNTSLAIDEYAENAVEYTDDLEGNNKAIFINGTTSTEDEIKDPSFNVISDGIALRRVISTYLWKEDSQNRTTTNSDGSKKTVTTYSYSKAWRDSSTFNKDNDRESSFNDNRFEHKSGHRNPSTLKYDKKTVFNNVELNGLSLNYKVINKIDKDLYSNLNISDTILPKHSNLKIIGNRFFSGINPNNPKVGDQYISFIYLPNSEISIAGALNDDEISEYKAKTYTVLKVLEGTHDLLELSSTMHSDNELETWLYRFGTFVGVYFGFVIFFSIITVLSSIIPLFGYLVSSGVGLLSLVLASITWSISFFFIWFSIRPLLAIGVIIIPIILIVYLVKTIQSKKEEEEK